MVPPCLPSGDLVEPARARPVPFCRHGFLPPPEMNPRVLVAAVPERRLAICIFTASCKIDLSPIRPKTAPATSISPTRSRAAENSGTLTASGAFTASRRLCSAIGRLRRLAAALLGRMIHHHHRAVGAGHCARHQDRVVVG